MNSIETIVRWETTIIASNKSVTKLTRIKGNSPWRSKGSRAIANNRWNRSKYYWDLTLDSKITTTRNHSKATRKRKSSAKLEESIRRVSIMSRLSLTKNECHKHALKDTVHPRRKWGKSMWIKFVSTVIFWGIVSSVWIWRSNKSNNCLIARRILHVKSNFHLKVSI